MKKIIRKAASWAYSQDASIGLEYGLVAGAISLSIIPFVIFAGPWVGNAIDPINAMIESRFVESNF